MLNNIEYKAYILQTIAFARTIVIKCEEIAFADNRTLETFYGINPGVDKTKWRYYLNLNGEYHETDDPMEIQSLDNGDTIEFTKANLELHLATKRAYRLGSYHYTRLTEKYPHQSNLINGIINPIPQSESIPAKDYSILRYNKDYVLWNEFQLIPALQDHITNMVMGSFKTEYLYTDNLMLPMLIGTLHGSLVSSILQIRKDAEETRYAHDFYIWSKLQSLGLSSIYRRVLDRKQTMWLYRNLNYVLRKLGRKKTFDELVNIILSHRRIPLAKYEVLQTTTDQIETFEPSPRLLSRPVNLIKEFGMSTKVWEVEEVITKELSLAIDNPDNRESGDSDADFKIRFGLHSDIPTKVLESTMVDTTNRNPDRIMRVLHNHWLYLTKKDLYSINLDVSDVRTGRHFRLTTAEAIVLWHYLIDKARGVDTLGTIPEYTYWRARKIVPPTVAQLMKLGHKDILTRDICQDILNVKIDFPRLISPDGFFNKCKEIFDGIWDHKKFYSSVPQIFTSSRRSNAVDACYETGIGKYTNIKTYGEWLTKMDLDFSDYTPDESLDLAWSIWSKATGWENVDWMSVGDIQRMLINVMKDLTSYTVQYIGSIDDSEGEFNLPYMMLLDGDFWHKDGETGLENDRTGLIIPNGMTVRSDHHTYADHWGGYIPDQQWGRHDAESIGCGRIDLPMCIWKIETDPDVNVNIISTRMTLREANSDGTLKAQVSR